VVLFDDFGSQASQRATDARFVHDAGLFSELHRCEIVARQAATDKLREGYVQAITMLMAVLFKSKEEG
jgi:hypothetical protein